MMTPTQTRSIERNGMRKSAIRARGITPQGCNTWDWIKCAGVVAACAPVCIGSIGTACIACMGSSYEACRDCI